MSIGLPHGKNRPGRSAWLPSSGITFTFSQLRKYEGVDGGESRPFRVSDGVRSESGRSREKEGSLFGRVIVKRILRKHGHPPDKQGKATETVLEQAQLLARDWAA